MSRLVIVESPFAAPSVKEPCVCGYKVWSPWEYRTRFVCARCYKVYCEVEERLKYARAALRDCLLRGEHPIASHLLYTQPGILSDVEPEERKLGIAAGLAWGEKADATVVYVDLGISSGMQHGIERAQMVGRPVETRKISGWSAVEVSG